MCRASKDRNCSFSRGRGSPCTVYWRPAFTWQSPSAFSAPLVPAWRRWGLWDCASEKLRCYLQGGCFPDTDGTEKAQGLGGGNGKEARFWLGSHGTLDLEVYGLGPFRVVLDLLELCNFVAMGRNSLTAAAFRNILYILEPETFNYGNFITLGACRTIL